MADLTPVLQRLLRESDPSQGLQLQVLGCGWYQLEVGDLNERGKLQVVCAFLKQLASFQLLRKMNVPYVLTAEMPQPIQLHNLQLQQQLLPSSRLKGSVTCDENKHRFQTVAAVTAHAIAAARCELLHDPMGSFKRISDIFMPYNHKSGYTINALNGYGLINEDTFDQLFVEEDRHISVEAAVRRLKLGHQLLQASLPEAIRNVCSSHRTSNYSTLDFLWQQREDEDKADDENTGLNAGAQQAEDSILDMTVSNSELAIVAENNPMGVWPASITRPLAKLKLGRLWGRKRKEDWYKSRWKYVPVVFDIEGDSERVALGMYDGEELGVQLCAATNYMNCKEQYDTLRGRQQQLEEQLQTARTRNEVATVRTNQAASACSLSERRKRMLANTTSCTTK